MGMANFLAIPFLVTKKGLRRAPFLVNKFVVFCSEARKSDAIAIASFGYDVENLKFWF